MISNHISLRLPYIDVDLHLVHFVAIDIHVIHLIARIIARTMTTIATYSPPPAMANATALMRLCGAVVLCTAGR